MDGLLRLSGAIDRLGDRFGTLANWLVLLACLVSAGNAGVRYLFSYSSNAWLEIQWYMFAGMVLLGASHTLKLNEHVRVDVVYSLVSDRVRLWIDTIGFALFMIPIMGLFTFLTYRFFYGSFVSNEWSSNPGGLILWPVKGILPLGFGLLSLQGISELIKRIAALRGRISFDVAYEKPLQ